MQQFDIVKHASITKSTSKLTEKLEIILFCLYLLNYIIKQHARITKYTFKKAITQLMQQCSYQLFQSQFLNCAFQYKWIGNTVQNQSISIILFNTVFSCEYWFKIKFQ